jgi:hypothetical protein
MGNGTDLFRTGHYDGPVSHGFFIPQSVDANRIFLAQSVLRLYV